MDGVFWEEVKGRGNYYLYDRDPYFFTHACPTPQLASLLVKNYVYFTFYSIKWGHLEKREEVL